jgi:hypothetical protein
MKDPTKGRKYLTDPNYYRLGYQLAAQLLNRRVARQRIAEDEFSRFAQRREDPDALDVAEQVLADTQLILAWYCDRSQRARRWRFWIDQLEPHERRLMTFLTETVEPCTHLAAAAALRNCGGGGSERESQHVEAVLERERNNKLSYRAYYNLACWHAIEAAKDPKGALYEAALGYLYRALSEAHHERGFELVDWARKDPSLVELHRERKRQFGAIMKRFERPPEPKRKKKKSKVG